MPWISVPLILVLFTQTPSVISLGTASVVNNCGIPVYYASVGQGQNAEMQLMQGSYSQQYSDPGNGISIKLAREIDGEVTQFEITRAAGKIHYDISNIDGNPFAGEGTAIVPSMQNDPNNPTCGEIICKAGLKVCYAAYNRPDDVRTHVCHEDSDLKFVICLTNANDGFMPTSGGNFSTPDTGASSSVGRVDFSPAVLKPEPETYSRATGYPTRHPPVRRELRHQSRMRPRHRGQI